MKTCKFLLLLGLSLALNASCGGALSGSAESAAEAPEADTVAMHTMAGIWLDAETEEVVFLVRGDSLFYPDPANLPVRFAIVEDSFIVYAVDTLSYPLLQQDEYTLAYESLFGEAVRLVRSVNPDDTLCFPPRQYAPIVLNETVRRDSVVFSPAGERYHLYIDITPTRYRVHLTTYTPEGLPTDNVYYDNNIHVGVYHGRNGLFSRDFVKADFQNLIPASFLETAILSNMEFGSVDREGIRFHATLCHPDGASCYVASILVGYDGNYALDLLEY